MSMLKRAAVAVALAVGGLSTVAGAASAATLTDGSGNLVPVGSTGTATSGTVALNGWINPTCTSSTIAVTVASSGPSVVTLDVTGSTWAGCPMSITPDHTPPWQFSTSGTTDLHHLGELTAALSPVGLTFAGFCPFGGSLTDRAGTSSHVAWSNGGSGAAGIDLADAQTLSGACGSGNVTVAWTFHGAAAGWTVVP